MLAGCAQPQPTELSSSTSPVIRDLKAEPPIITVGQSSTLTVDAEDPNGAPLSYQWKASAGDIIGQGSTVRYTASFCCAGSNRVSVTVKNDRSGSASSSIEVFVN